MSFCTGFFFHQQPLCSLFVCIGISFRNLLSLWTSTTSSANLQPCNAEQIAWKHDLCSLVLQRDTKADIVLSLYLYYAPSPNQMIWCLHWALPPIFPCHPSDSHTAFPALQDDWDVTVHSFHKINLLCDGKCVQGLAGETDLKAGVRLHFHFSLFPLLTEEYRVFTLPAFFTATPAAPPVPPNTHAPSLLSDNLQIITYRLQNHRNQEHHYIYVRLQLTHIWQSLEKNIFSGSNMSLKVVHQQFITSCKWPC